MIEGLARPQPKPGATIRVAVYGTLRQGGGLHHHYLPDAKFLGKGILSSAEMYSLGGCPGIVLKPNSDRKVVVEVFEIDLPLLKQLDSIEGFYDRAEVKVDLGGKKVKAYTYCLSEREMEGFPLVEGGDWMAASESDKWVAGMPGAVAIKQACIVRFNTTDGEERRVRISQEDFAIVTEFLESGETDKIEAASAFLLSQQNLNDEEEFERYAG